MKARGIDIHTSKIRFVSRALLLFIIFTSSAILSGPALINSDGSSQVTQSSVSSGSLAASQSSVSVNAPRNGILGSRSPIPPLDSESTGMAMIWTDQSSYHPQSIVTLYGSGFLANASISVSVTQPNATVNTSGVTSDSYGNFTTAYQLDDLNGTYYATATDGVNNATTSFTDPPKTDTTTTLITPVNGTTLNTGSSYKWNGTVIPVSGTIPAGVTVTLYYTTDGTCPLNGAGTGTALATTSTLSGGNFNSSFTAPSAGSYNFFARFAGNSNFANSNSACASVTVAATYSVTFGQTGIPTSGVTWGVTVGSTRYTGTGSSIVVSGLSGSKTYSYDSSVSGAAGVRYECTTGCSGSVSSSTGSVSASFQTQYNITFTQTGSGSSVSVSWDFGNSTSGSSAVPFSLWADASTASISFTYPTSIAGSTGVRYELTSVNQTSPYSISSGPVTITGTYQTQYLIAFGQKGCSSAVNVQWDFGNGTSGTTAANFTMWADATTGQVTFTYPPFINETTEIHCALISVNTTSPYSISSGPVTIAATYKIQYLMAFAVTPIGAGTTTPSKSTWYDANSSGNSISASANTGYTFSKWTFTCLSGSSCLTIVNGSSYSTTFSIYGPGTITAHFTINTAITYTGATSGEYSDPVKLSATLKDAFGNVLSGYSLTFTLGSQSVSATTDTSGIASTTLVLNQSKGSYSVVVTFAGDSTYTGSSSTTSFTLNPEPASLVYTGTTSVITTTTMGYITLSAQITSELDDAVPSGDITNAMITFVIYQASSLSTPVYVSTPTAVTETSPGVGTISLTIACASFGNNGCSNENTYIVYAILTGATYPSANNYYVADDSYNTLTIYTPNGQFVTLGGWITDPNTGSHGNFGGVVRIAKNGNIQGSFVYVFRGACPTGYSSTQGLCDYMFKTTSWSSGTLGFSSFGCATKVVCYASFQARGVAQILDSVTGALLYSQGNIQISVGAWDNTGTTNNGGVDQITISASLPQPLPAGSATATPTSDQVGTVSAPISLRGGNVVVHSK